MLTARRVNIQRVTRNCGQLQLYPQDEPDLSEQPRSARIPMDSVTRIPPEPAHVAPRRAAIQSRWHW